MATTGYCVVKPVHVASIVKRYRQLCGELAYRRKHAGATEQIEQLNAVCKSLLHSLRIYQVDFTQLNLRPIRYRPPEPVSQLQLVRALLSTMRIADEPLHIDDIVLPVIGQANLPNTTEMTGWLHRRAGRALVRLQKRGIVRQTAPDIWTINS